MSRMMAWEGPVNAITDSTTAVIAMLVMMMRRRP